MEEKYITTLKNKLESEIRQLTSTLEAQIEKLNQTQRLAKIGSWEWDVKTGTVIWSDMMYELLGLKPGTEEPSYELALKYVHADDKDEYVKTLQHSLEHGHDYYCKNRIQRDDGLVIPVISRGKCFKNSKNGVICMIGTVQDVSNQSILLQENEDLRQLAFLATSDLKSPMLTIDNYSKLLSKNCYDQLDETDKMHLTYILHATAKMKLQMNDLLDYFELGQNKTSTFINCNEIFELVLDNLKGGIKASNCSFEIDTLPTVQGYKSEIAILFHNLISNAIKFKQINLDLHIRIQCIKETGFWKFIFSDNGIGIRQMNLNKIFTLFERLHLTDEYAGTGIGLAQCRKIVEIHGGNIWATSVYNTSSSFYFTLRA